MSKLERRAKRLKEMKKAQRRLRRVGNVRQFIKKFKAALDTLDVAAIAAHLVANREKLFKAVMTDLGGAQAGGAPKAVAAAAVARVGKEAVGLYVGTLLGVSSAREDELFASGAFKAYLVMNLKRRAATNMIYYAILAIGNPAKPGDIGTSIAVSTSFQVGQDLAMKLPPLKPLQMLVELVRKTAATGVKRLIK